MCFVHVPPVFLCFPHGCNDVLQHIYILELGSCVLAINLFCDFLVLVLVSLQTTHVLWVNNVYNSWVV